MRRGGRRRALDEQKGGEIHTSSIVGPVAALTADWIPLCREEEE